VSDVAYALVVVILLLIDIYLLYRMFTLKMFTNGYQSTNQMHRWTIVGIVIVSFIAFALVILPRIL
jgi:hypothetical protein